MRVLIVGGGSAGWITAAYLDANLNGVGGPARSKFAEITLIESDAIGRIGVGEATVPTIRRTLAQIGVAEQEFLRAADATFKHAIRFEDWAAPGHVYYHPFDRVNPTGFGTGGLMWLSSDRAAPFATTVSVQPFVAEAGLAPKTVQHKDYEGAITYAYHMDAEKFADYLRDLCKSRGVTHVVDDVVQVDKTGPEHIAAVETKTGLRLEADLFIDCSGFARVLIGKALQVPFESYGDWLLCDRAVTLRVPNALRPASEIRPYTTSRALSAGWMWDIGLQERRGTGYVYSSQFISDDEAEAELRAQEGSHADELPARRLRFQSGKVTAPWTGNCVAIGLSAGFLEPLESTGLFLVEEGVGYLCEMFPRFGPMGSASTFYNEKMRTRYEECVDFINLHYVLSPRRDTPFWRAATAPERVTPRLRDLLDLWDVKPPSRLDFTDTSQLFAHTNYEYVLYGMGWLPGGLPPLPQPLPPFDRRRMEAAEAKARQLLPTHGAYLQSVRPGTPPA